MSHRTMIEYRVLHPKPYEAQCHDCAWRAERQILKAAQTAAKKHEAATAVE